MDTSSDPPAEGTPEVTEAAPDSAAGDATDVGFEEHVRRFHDLYCQSPERTWKNTFWLGVPLIKCPLDLWIYQEILYDEGTRPDLIVETGTMRGGSAHFLASIMDVVGSGRIVTVDNRFLEERPQHPRITYLTGSSTDPDIVRRVREAVEPGERVMVILDSKHDKEHVLGELEAYADLVTEGNYLIVEDTNINSWRGYYKPGPLEAVREFLSRDDSFVIDRSRERLMMTFNPSGYLLRTRAPG